MSNLNVNGRTVDPNTIRQIPVPAGQTPESYVNQNKELIQKNFRDELYFEHEGNLFVTSDEFVVENLGIRNPGDAKLKVGVDTAVALFIDNEPDAHKVTAFKIEGAGQHQAWLEDALKIEQGERINLHDLQKEADRLFESERFLEVNFNPEAAEDGIQLTLHVQPVPESVEIQGPGLSAEQARELRELIPRPMTRENITAGLQAIQAQMDSDNSLILSGMQPQVHNGKLNISLSLAHTPQSLSIQGLSSEESQRAQSFFQKPLNPENAAAGLERLRAHYNAQGMVLPQAVIEYGYSATGETQLNLNLQKAPMPTALEFSGVSVYDEASVRALFQQPLNMENIQKGMRALEQKYKDDGYVLKGGEGVSADLTRGVLTISANEMKLGEIRLTGNDKTQNEVIQREMRLRAGEPVNVKTLQEDLQRVQGTGLFVNVQQSVQANAESDEAVDIHVHTAEEKSSAFNVGAGYSLSNGPFASTSLNMGNLMGMDRDLRADFTLGTKVWGGGLSYYDPWAFEGRTSLGASVFHRHWDGPYSDETRTGAKATIGRPLGDIYDSNWRWDLTVDGQRIGIDPQYSVSGSGVDYRVGVRPALTYNSLDNMALPTSGSRFQIGAEPVYVSGEMLGKFDANYNSFYSPTEKLTLSFGAKAGTVLGDAPLYEKYNNAGLGNTIMGFDSDGSMVGSNQLLGKVGARYHVWGPVHAAVDATAGDYFDGTDINLKAGVGAGVDINLGGFGVVRARYGVPLMGQREQDSGGSFHIGLGFDF